MVSGAWPSSAASAAFRDERVKHLVDQMLMTDVSASGLINLSQLQFEHDDGRTEGDVREERGYAGPVYDELCDMMKKWLFVGTPMSSSQSEDTEEREERVEEPGLSAMATHGFPPGTSRTW